MKLSTFASHNLYVSLPFVFTLSQKNDTGLASYNFDLHQPILIIFDRTVANKVRSQMMLYFPPHLTDASALPSKTRKHANRIFLTHMLYYCFSRVQPVVAEFLQFCWLETRILAGIDFQNLVINWVQLWPVVGYSSGEMKLIVLRNSSGCWRVLRTSCTGACMSCVAERQIILLSTMRLITANICWDSKISYQ